MLSHDGIGLDNDQRLPPAGPYFGEGNPEQAVSLLNLRSLLTTLQNEELLTESEIFSRQVPDKIEFLYSRMKAFADDSMHPRTLNYTSCKFNDANAYEYLRGT